ncbi:uncharacterized protein [Nicotiana sylvestris]|uniref:uncharacterized protein n=1 Tax=Nicotiana sylvestris TaxID=4096 RepID=UPI00388C8E39
MGLLQPVPQTRQNPASPAYRASTRCAYHSGAEGHDTDDFWTLKRAVENLIEQKQIVLKDEDVPNVTNNPLPAHNNGPVIGMICEDKEFNPALKVIIAIADVEKNPKAVTKQDKGEKKMLIKTLNEAYVPIKTIVEQLERMAEMFFAVNQISFTKNHLSPKGATHNKALHLTVKCEGYYVKRVMLDGGSGVDICPLSTLQRMEIGTERIRPNNVYVCAFDSIKRDTIGEIDFILTIGSVDFEVTFQVLDMDTSYNFLLGRPWIHAAGAVPSTLH